MFQGKEFLSECEFYPTCNFLYESKLQYFHKMIIISKAKSFISLNKEQFFTKELQISPINDYSNCFPFWKTLFPVLCLARINNGSTIPVVKDMNCFIQMKYYYYKVCPTFQTQPSDRIYECGPPHPPRWFLYYDEVYMCCFCELSSLLYNLPEDNG